MMVLLCPWMDLPHCTHHTSINCQFFFTTAHILSFQVFILTTMKVNVASSNLCCWRRHQWTMWCKDDTGTWLVEERIVLWINKVNKLPQPIQNFITKNLGWWSITREKGFWLLTKNGMFGSGKWSKSLRVTSYCSFVGWTSLAPICPTLNVLLCIIPGSPCCIKEEGHQNPRYCCKHQHASHCLCSKQWLFCDLPHNSKNNTWPIPPCQ